MVRESVRLETTAAKKTEQNTKKVENHKLDLRQSEHCPNGR